MDNTYLLIAFETDSDDTLLHGHSGYAELQDMANLHIYAVNADTWKKITDEIGLQGKTRAFRKRVSNKQFGRIEMLIEKS